jgi:hypothetical protein
MYTKTLIAALLFGMLLPAQAGAWDLRAGFETVQVRDKHFASFEGDGFDNLWHPFDYGRFDALRIDGAVAPSKKFDVVFGARLGQESGELENVSTELWLIEPSGGVRRRVALGKWVEAHGQISLSVPYMRMVVHAPQDEKYWAVFPVLTPAVGLTLFPVDDTGNRPVGVTADVGYGTPAPLEFSSHKGVSPGTLDYAGLTYGVYLTLRFEEAPMPHVESNELAK